jgi:WD40 repeat protein
LCGDEAHFEIVGQLSSKSQSNSGAMQKRSAQSEGPYDEGDDVSTTPAKKVRTEAAEGGDHAQLVTNMSSSSALIVKDPTAGFAPNRTSRLQAPTMLLSGHAGPVFSLAFSSSGESLASAGMDTHICE